MRESTKKMFCGSIFLFISTSALAAVDTNIKIPFEDIQPTVPNFCNGDEILLTGDIHILFTTTIDASGGGHFTFHFQPAGASGVGVPSGLRYRAVGLTRGSDNFTPGQTTTMTFVNNFRLIAPGPGGGTLHFHENIHVTINPNGTVTADVEHVSVTCR